jgi:hypothetical protein
MFDQQKRLADAKSVLEAEIIRFAREKEQLQSSQKLLAPNGIYEDPPIVSGPSAPRGTLTAAPNQSNGYNGNLPPGPPPIIYASQPAQERVYDSRKSDSAFEPAKQNSNSASQRTKPPWWQQEPQASPLPVPPGVALARRTLASRGSGAVASFCSDRGWGESDQSHPDPELLHSAGGGQPAPWLYQPPQPSVNPLQMHQAAPPAPGEAWFVEPGPDPKVSAGQAPLPDNGAASDGRGSAPRAAAAPYPGAAPGGGPGQAGGPAAGAVVTRLTLDRAMDEVRQAGAGCKFR